MGPGKRLVAGHRGDTLVEVIVAVSIMALLYVLGATTTRGVSEQQAVRMTVNKLADDLRWIQQHAIADGVAWKIEVLSGGTSYQRYYAGSCLTPTDPVSWKPYKSPVQVAGGAWLVPAPLSVVYECSGRRSPGQVVVQARAGDQYARTITILGTTGLQLE